MPEEIEFQKYETKYNLFELAMKQRLSKSLFKMAESKAVSEYVKLRVTEKMKLRNHYKK